jgi:hypothetical protein
MADRIWHYALPLLLAAASSLALAQPPRTHNACDDGDGDLDQTTPNVVYDESLIANRRHQNQCTDRSR